MNSKKFEQKKSSIKKPFPKKDAPHKKTKPAEKKDTHPAGIDSALKKVFSNIGKPLASEFVPDDFQLKSVEAIKSADCLVIAPTGSGKTWIAQEAIAHTLLQGGRCWYASPLKALTNAKWVEFQSYFGAEKVGIVTGDIKENTDAQVITGTTEILRNCLYDAMTDGSELAFDLVVLDEAHYLGDANRGVVWEEILIYLPARINVLLLSATIGNGAQMASWLQGMRKKDCILITDYKRSVPLYPLFFHPTERRLLPFMEKGKVQANVKSFCSTRCGKRGAPVGLTSIVDALRQYNLLPAIFFMKSRLVCDRSLMLAAQESQLPRDDHFDASLDETLAAYPYLKKHKHLSYLKNSRLASHHGGHLPLWKFCVEKMMKQGYLDAIFATTTVAAGVNFPARTVVITDSDTFDGNKFNPLNSSEFQQMAGRAGRRGIDKIGFVFIVPGAFMDVEYLSTLLDGTPKNIDSQIKNTFSMCLNLISSHRIEDIKDVFKNSFAAFQKSGNSSGLWNDFLRYLTFLQEDGFVDADNHLSAMGEVASKLRIDEPLIFVQALKENVFSRTDEKTLAALVAAYAFDGDEDLAFESTEVPRKLKNAYRHSEEALKPLLRRMEKQGFTCGKRYLGIAYAVYRWADGYEWKDIIKETGFAEGNMVSLVLRVSEHLRQLANIESYPEVAAKAWSARELLLREPVLFDI